LHPRRNKLLEDGSKADKVDAQSWPNFSELACGATAKASRHARFEPQLQPAFERGVHFSGNSQGWLPENYFVPVAGRRGMFFLTAPSLGDFSR
jgi:hypothetical protein